MGSGVDALIPVQPSFFRSKAASYPTFLLTSHALFPTSRPLDLHRHACSQVYGAGAHEHHITGGRKLLMTGLKISMGIRTTWPGSGRLRPDLRHAEVIRLHKGDLSRRTLGFSEYSRASRQRTLRLSGTCMFTVAAISGRRPSYMESRPRTVPPELLFRSSTPGHSRGCKPILQLLAVLTFGVFSNPNEDQSI